MSSDILAAHGLKLNVAQHVETRSSSNVRTSASARALGTGMKGGEILPNGQKNPEKSFVLVDETRRDLSEIFLAS